ncbi:MAG: hypothetical protein M5U22_21050 [Thermoleophilia bacterium]|nr:hypothetical protein [Thermoleophilia bacterium]
MQIAGDRADDHPSVGRSGLSQQVRLQERGRRGERLAGNEHLRQEHLPGRVALAEGTKAGDEALVQQIMGRNPVVKSLTDPTERLVTVTSLHADSDIA